MNRLIPAVAACLFLTACSGGGGGGTAKAAGGTVTAGPLGLAAPAGWRLEHDEQPDSYRIVTSGTCDDAGASQLSGCKAVEVLGASYVAPDPDSDTALPLQPYQVTDTHSAQYVEDTGYQCPADPKLRAGTKAAGARLVKRSKVTLGTGAADYSEWTIPCWTRDPESGQPLKKSATSYTERDWYVASRKMLIVDEWSTPGLDAVLAKAAWG